MAKILLLDGDTDRVAAIQHALEDAQYQVALASNTSFALTMLEWNRPDAIVSQAEVPDLDGYELCSIIRSDPTTRNLPFLMLTGLAGPTPGASARAGVDRVLGGNFIPSDVVASVRRMLHRAMKVLVVDDALAVRRALSLALESRQITAISVTLVSEALGRIEREHPDLVVCDVNLPDGNGYQVCEFVKTRQGAHRVPVILMSGDPDESLRKKARVQPDELLHKPFLPDELAAKIERLLTAIQRAGRSKQP